MNAIILAGGMGQRLRPLTEELPKPMIPILNKPLMEYSLELLKKNGITSMGVTLMYLPQMVKNYFEDGSKFGVDISYYVEDEPLGTAGSVKLAEEKLDDTFVVISGDALTNVQIDKILKYHKSIEADVTIVLSKQSQPLEYGVVLTDTSGRITSFMEKPMWESVVSDTVNTGIYVIEKKILEKIPPKTEFDFSNDLFPLLLRENYRLFGYITEDYWCDLGNPQSYKRAINDILAGKVFGKKYENVLNEGVVISENVKLNPPVYIGKNVVINGKCTIGPNVCVGDNSIIENSKITSSVLLNGVLINSSCFNDCIIGENSVIDKCILSGNNTVGSKVKINKNSLIKRDVSINNNMEIPEDSVIEENVINAFITKGKFFCDNGICGLWNHEIFYQDLLGIASTFSSEKILVASNKSDLAIALSELLASFYILCGSRVYLSVANEASSNFFAFANNVKAVYIYEENEKINIRFINEKGLNISHKDEKKIDFNKKEFSLNRGKIIRLKSIDKDFEFYLNSSIPFSKENVQISSDEKFRLHNIIWSDNKESFLSDKIAKAFISAKNGAISNVYNQSGRISTADFLRLKCDIISYLGGKNVFLPSYTPDEIIDEAKKNGLNIFKKMQHMGDTMNQAESFVDIAVLMEYVPSFFAQALAFYLSKNEIKNNNVLIARYDFKTSNPDTCNTIFLFNKNREKDKISANYRNGHITVVPQNNGYYFTAYGRFANEEYAPDIIENFVSENTVKE